MLHPNLFLFFKSGLFFPNKCQTLPKHVLLCRALQSKYLASKTQNQRGKKEQNTFHKGSIEPEARLHVVLEIISNNLQQKIKRFRSFC